MHERIIDIIASYYDFSEYFGSSQVSGRSGYMILKTVNKEETC